MGNTVGAMRAPSLGDEPAEYTERHAFMSATRSYLSPDGADRVLVDIDDGRARSLEDGDGLGFIADHWRDDDEEGDDDDDDAEYSDTDEDAAAAAGALGFFDTTPEDEEFAYTYRMLERGVYAVRRGDEDALVYVIARAEEPLVHFCHMLRDAEKEWSAHTGDAWQRSDAENAPGIITVFTTEVLGDVHAAAPLNVAVVGVDAHAEATAAVAPDDIEEVRDGVVLNTRDRDYDYKLRSVFDALLRGDSVSATVAAAGTGTLNDRHMREFASQGADFHGAPDASPRAGFAAHSPVRDDELWYVVNLPYYYLYKSFRRLCATDSGTLCGVSARASDAPADEYVLDASADYTAAQERAVLRALLARGRKREAEWRDEAHTRAIVLRHAERLHALVAATDADALPPNAAVADALAGIKEAADALQRSVERLKEGEMATLFTHT